MCTDHCKQHIDQSISYNDIETDNIETDDVEATYCFIKKEDCMYINGYEQALGKSISHNDVDHT